MNNTYKEKLIAELNENDSYVVIAGLPVEISKGIILLDDGKSSIQVILNDNNIPENAKFIRVFGSIINFDGKLCLHADFLQDLSSIDRFLYDKVNELIRK